MKKIYLVILSGLFFFHTAFAQQTGSFDMTVNFAGNPNFPISFYVPSNYNPANPYKLIVGLHGLGDNCQNYRNYLAQNVAGVPSSPVYNAIVVAPSNGDGSNTDFWTYPCDTSIITIAMNLAKNNYNIDANGIYLQGISLGGRAALRYGLINYSRFCGIELWCPAVQSLAEANNQDPSFTYPYQNGKYIPVSISIGSEDGYIENGQLDASMNQFLSAGALANMQIELGAPHGAPSSAYIFNNYNYINANVSTYANNDAGISDIVTPFDEECSTSFSPVIKIQNKGANNLTSVVINYQIDGGPIQTYNWSGNLKRLEKTSVTLPSQSVALGSHTFNAYTSSPNGQTDAVPSNDASLRNFTSLTNGSVSLSEGFENAAYPPVGWKQSGTDKVWKWQKVTGIGANGSSACIKFDNWTFDKTGRRYSIYTAEYDFTNAGNAILTYDYAYVPYQDAQGIYGDTLVVFYSTSCGSTWTQLLYKGGMQLSSTGSTTNSWFIPSSSAQWKTETINLSSLVGQPKVMLRFEDRPNWSNLLYLDNVKLTGITAVNEEQKEAALFVFPNPMNTSATIISEMKDCSVSIFDVTGNLVKSFSNISQFPLAIQRENLSSGMYFIELRSENKIERTKLIVQ
ncbi:MAG: T9SS type A sorting domain-containing protein [Bacteroidetes bacterium]|nr:T9SS type A sorting domain-containing protein [Bacteroidota bacterium]